ncbi:MAG TPA: PAS domain-containing protein [Methyloceanibacter sp.]|nr:PAS domain-containing protein [Methyloceanibacter sp.]
MTTLALLPGPLKRLFSRFDAAGTRDHALELALDHWRVRRGDRLLPRMSDMDVAQLGPLASHVFVFQRGAKADWSLQLVGDSAKRILGPPAHEPALSTLENRRVAARLRLIFEWVSNTGEAVSASFISPDQSGEILAAPLGTDGKKVDAIFGGIVSRQAG